MQYQCKKLFNGYASIRDTTIENCIARGEDLVVIFDGDMMVLPLDKLKNPIRFQIHKTIFRSKYNRSQCYSLFDFKFVPGKDRQGKLI